ncbi:HDOD domain-containing protein [Pseudomonas sp. CCC2.2]|uniref:HDOD domain-containing protein n=1 Tax=Pseudomonas sp. CCC2.2 TaxID=3048605 RepID=UPI002B239E85|nr:HDOD domain-containing protein [Pseudomonas sp. CCC2.2]MEB0150486.1 HDOD domain-containing protein [Pseudomonas sp. CCC2.2]
MQVMILEDDPWIADMLKQIVLNLCPDAAIDIFHEVLAANEACKRTSYQLVLADWNLSDSTGVRLLHTLLKNNRPAPLVVVTGRADRENVLSARSLGISTFISKPFQVPSVVARLKKLLPDSAERSLEPLTEQDFIAFLGRLSAAELDIPLLSNVKDTLQLILKGEELDLRELVESWQYDPALSAHLVAASNSSAYIGVGHPYMSLPEALQRLGGPTSLNLALCLALRQANEQSSPLVQTLAQAHLNDAEALSNRVTRLARECGVDPAPLQCAALLHRIGELCVIYQAQAWEHKGHSLSESALTQAMREFSNPFAISLKAHWGLPMALRDLIGAVYVLPPAQFRREKVLMRLAAAEINGEEPRSLERLRRLAGLA